MSSSNRRDQILAAATDAAVNFIYYDRKNDEDLPPGEIESAIASGEVSITDILKIFHDTLLNAVT